VGIVAVPAVEVFAIEQGTKSFWRIRVGCVDIRSENEDGA
jgi:hypothetical protein